MKQAIVTVGMLAALVIGFVAYYAGAQESMAPAAAPGDSMKDACPVCAMAMDDPKDAAQDKMQGKDKAQWRAKHMEMMKAAGVTDEEMAQVKALKGAQLYMDSPSVLLGKADDLKLSDDQKAKLMAVQKDARAKALAVLTDDQKKMMGPASDTPMTMMQTWKQMHEKMHAYMMKEGKGKMGMMGGKCPMMMKGDMATPAAPGGAAPSDSTK